MPIYSKNIEDSIEKELKSYSFELLCGHCARLSDSKNVLGGNLFLLTVKSFVSLHLRIESQAKSGASMFCASVLQATEAHAFNLHRIVG